MNKKALILALGLGAITAVVTYDTVSSGKSIKVLAKALVSAL